MVVNRILGMCLMVAAYLLPQPVSAGALIRELVCDTDNGRQPQYIERNSSLPEAFAADIDKGTIYINPTALAKKPQPVVNYEFAMACLKVAQRGDDMCSTVRFMRARNLLFNSDLEVLQTYFASRARMVKDPAEATRFYRRIKDLYSCF